MAELIRNTHRLPTIRVRFRPLRRGAQLVFDSFYGNEALAHEEIDADAVGIRPRLNVREYRYAEFQLPDGIVGPLADSLAAVVAPDEPRWLQVGPSSGHLAVLPWERLLQERLGAPLLRIPNFLADPVFLTGPLRLALCVSSPQAKTPFSAAEHAHMVIDVVRAAVPPGAQIHVFADLDAYGELQARVGGADGLHLHDPHDADRYGVGDTQFVGHDATLTSPWLRWMADALQSSAVDAVHFVCPGFFRRDQGALALARSPMLNVDRQWSALVAVDELVAFLNRVGAWTTAFSPPHDNVWAIGLRLLADRLAWMRPGPTLLHDAEHGAPDDLGGAYRFLFGDGPARPPATPSLMLYSHPKRLERFAEPVVNFESVSTFGIGRDALDGVSEVLDTMVLKGNREEQLSAGATAAPWQQSARRVLDQVLLQSEGQTPATKRGVIDALARIDRLLESTARGQ